MQNMHKTTHDRHLTGVNWPINNRCRVSGARVEGAEERAQAVRAEERGGGLRL